ncbi:hypothetical protein [Ruegeria sp. MALMAid1280]|uniref:hypothetical protein n=1 Tax=Ruegeria sp. MALMAid1280 TaxID=3411634 RepID=UPI003BA3CFFA
MFVKNPRVQLSWQLYYKLIHQNLSVPSYRVMLGIVLQHEFQEHWHDIYCDLPEQTESWAELSEFRKIVGLSGRDWKKQCASAVEELSGTGWFADIELVHGNRSIKWTLDRAIVEAQLDRDKYVLLSLEEIAACRTSLEHQFVSELTRTRQMKAPEFDCHALKAVPKRGNNIDWKRFRPRLERFFDKWGRDEGTSFVVGTARSHLGDVTNVTIRTRTSHTNWFGWALYKFPPNSRVYLYENGAMRQLGAEEIFRKVREKVPGFIPAKKRQLKRAA